VFTVLSLVLAVVVAGLWVRSLNCISNVQFAASQLELGLLQTNGIFGVTAALDAGLIDPLGGTDVYGWHSWTRYPESTSWRYDAPYFNSWGFGLQMDRTVGRPAGNWQRGDRPLVIVHAPHWTLLALLCVPPAFAFARRARQRKRARSGACPSCGYDLRSTPERCPECGTVPGVVKVAA
jgi:hypothetical protein